MSAQTRLLLQHKAAIKDRAITDVDSIIKAVLTSITPIVALSFELALNSVVEDETLESRLRLFMLLLKIVGSLNLRLGGGT